MNYRSTIPNSKNYKKKQFFRQYLKLEDYKSFEKYKKSEEELRIKIFNKMYGTIFVASFLNNKDIISKKVQMVENTMNVLLFLGLYDKEI